MAFQKGHTNNIGRKHSLETKKKLSELTKKQILEKGNPFKGKTHSDEWKIKKSEEVKKQFLINGHPSKGRKHTEESLKKMSESTKKRFVENGHPMACKKHSLIAKRKMSESHKGKTTWNKGKKMLPPSEETRRKISEGNKGKKMSEEAKKKISETEMGKIVSEETKKKLSDARRGKPAIWNSGSNSRLWKGGVTPLIRLIRNCFKTRQWRSDVFTRDNYTCQLCSKRGGIIHADHIKSFSDIFYENKIISLEQALACEEFWNINNGRTLCLSCHRTTDSWGKNSTKSYANQAV